MSVSIGWRPDDPKKLTYISATSSFHAALERLFGSFPITLDRGNIAHLEGLEACEYEGAGELISAIQEKGSIIVEAEW